MKKLLAIVCFAGLTACQKSPIGIASTGNTAPMTVVVDGQSNGQRLPSQDIQSAFASLGYTNVNVINIAVGGTFLKEHTQGGRLYNNTVQVVGTQHPDLYIWWQGEAEACYGGPGKDTYGMDLTNFIRDLRSKATRPFSVVVVKLSKNMFVGISPSYPEGTPFWRTVREQQDRLFMPNLYTITIDDLKGDGLHYGPSEYQTAANRIANAFVSRTNQ